MLMMMSSIAPGRCDTIELITAAERGEKYRYQQGMVSRGMKTSQITSRSNCIAATTQPIKSRSDIETKATERHGTHPTTADNLNEVADEELHFLSLALELVTGSLYSELPCRSVSQLLRRRPRLCVFFGVVVQQTSTGEGRDIERANFETDNLNVVHPFGTTRQGSDTHFTAQNVNRAKSRGRAHRARPREGQPDSRVEGGNAYDDGLLALAVFDGVARA